MSERTHRPAPDDESLQRRRAALSGMRARRRSRDVPEGRRRASIEWGLDLGLEAALSVGDRNISLFSRGFDPQCAGVSTFARMPYVEDVRTLGQYDAAVVGVPFDRGTTYRCGARFGPEAVRSIIGVYDSESPDLGMDLVEEISIGDAGDIFVIPSNIEKSFDQIDLGVSHILDQGCFPVIIGGWIGNGLGIQVADEIDTTVITMFDVDERGVDDVMDIALELAWKDADAVYLSFDIDVFDPSHAPGTGTPDAGGMSSREGLQAARRAAGLGEGTFPRPGDRQRAPS